jgi:hypothetical protein
MPFSGRPVSLSIKNVDRRPGRLIVTQRGPLWRLSACSDGGPVASGTSVRSARRASTPDHCRRRASGSEDAQRASVRSSSREWPNSRELSLLRVDGGNRLGPGESAEENARSVQLRKSECAPIIGKQIAEDE